MSYLVRTRPTEHNSHNVKYYVYGDSLYAILHEEFVNNIGESFEYSANLTAWMLREMELDEGLTHEGHRKLNWYAEVIENYLESIGENHRNEDSVYKTPFIYGWGEISVGPEEKMVETWLSQQFEGQVEEITEIEPIAGIEKPVCCYVKNNKVYFTGVYERHNSLEFMRWLEAYLGLTNPDE